MVVSTIRDSYATSLCFVFILVILKKHKEEEEEEEEEKEEEEEDAPWGVPFINWFKLIILFLIYSWPNLKA